MARDEIQVDGPALRAAVQSGAITETERALLAEVRRLGINTACLALAAEGLLAAGGQYELAAAAWLDADTWDDAETIQAERARCERNYRILKRMRAAEDAVDRDEANRLWATQILTVGQLVNIKRLAGAAWIRASGLDIRLADAEFGSGWLDEP